MTPLEFDHQIADLTSTLRAFSRRFTTDQDDSSDLVQDTIFKALSYRDKFVKNTNLKGWLFTIMRNTFINSYRKNHRSRILHDSSKEQYFLNVEDDHTFSVPDSQIEYYDILRNIESLKDEYLLPFKMLTTGYKYHEIAEHLGIPMGTVKNRIHHARKEIQKKMQYVNLGPSI